MTGTVARLVVVAAVSAGAGHAAPIDPARAARIDEVRQQVLDGRYQAALPDGTGSGPGTAGRPGRAAGGEISERDPGMRFDVRRHDETSPMSTVMTFLLWAMVIVVSVLGGFWVASELSRYGGDAELPPEAEPHARLAAAAGAIIVRPLEDADELARRGEFAEAIHTLLLRTLHELARTAAVQVAPATTSREILARVPLLADARGALADLITAVEVTHFGDEPASAADYERCRAQFHVFAAAFRRVGT